MVQPGDEINFFDTRAKKARYKQHVLNFWNNQCAYCREPLGRSGTLDHIVPRSKGGETVRSNLVACCYSCNTRKGSLSEWREWFRVQEFWTQDAEDAIDLWLNG